MANGQVGENQGCRSRESSGGSTARWEEDMHNDLGTTDR